MTADALSTTDAGTLPHLTALCMSDAFPFSTALPITILSSSVSVSASNAASGGQVVVNETGVNFNCTVSNPGQTTSNSKENQKPFVLKLKTKQIRVCQSCCEDYDGANDTLGLMVARSEQ